MACYDKLMREMCSDSGVVDCNPEPAKVHGRVLAFHLKTVMLSRSGERKVLRCSLVPTQVAMRLYRTRLDAE